MLTLIRGGRYGEPLPKKTPRQPAPEKAHNLEESLGGPTPDCGHGWHVHRIAHSPTSITTRWVHDAERTRTEPT